MPSPSFSHLDAKGNATMVSVGHKPDQHRFAQATGTLLVKPATIRLLKKNALPKGDVLTVAKIAGIHAAKKTSDLIPLCHPLPLHKVDLHFKIKSSSITIEATAETIGKTGVEMEALTAVSVAALTLFDMCKAVDKTMKITGIEVMKKIKQSLLLLALLFSTASFLTLNAQMTPKNTLNIEYAKAGDKPLLLDLYPPTTGSTEKNPCVIWIHGGGWYSGSKEHNPLLPLVNQGYALVSINYRLTSEASFPAQIHDCKAAIRWVRANATTYNIDPDRIGVIGFSAGGHLAALLGTSGDLPELEGTEGTLGVSSQVQAVVDGFGPTDFNSMWSEIQNHPSFSIPGKMNNVEALKALLKASSPEEQKKLNESASPLHYVRPHLPPFYIFHGTDDQTVPVDQSQKLDAALRANGNDCKLDLIPGKGHGVQGPEAAKRIIAFLDAKLKNRSPKNSSTSPTTQTQTPALIPTSLNPIVLSKKPSGIYALFPPDRIGIPAPSPVNAKIWNSQGIDGIALRTFWEKVEPTENERNWSHFDDGLKAARQNHKSVSLSLASGIFSPAWIFDAGAQKFQITAQSNYNSSMTKEIPPPWDLIYLQKWGSLIREMGARYDKEPEVSYVVIGGIGMVVESYFVKQPDDLARLQKNGGAAAWLNGAKKVIDLFAESFPQTPIILAMGEPFPGPEGKSTLQSLVEYGLQKYPGHFGLMHHGLTAISGKEYYPNNAIAENSTTCSVGFQMVWSTQGNGAAMIRGSLETALQHGVSLGAHFIEVYGEDLLQNRYGTLFEKISTELKKK